MGLCLGVRQSFDEKVVKAALKSQENPTLNDCLILSIGAL